MGPVNHENMDEHRGHFFVHGDDPEGVYYAVSDKQLPAVICFLEALGCEKITEPGAEVSTYSADITDQDGPGELDKENSDAT